MEKENDKIMEYMIAGKGIPLTEENIISFVTTHRRYASFVEITKYFDDTEGDLVFGFLDKNIVIWANISHKLYDILTKLIDNKSIGLVATVPLVYMVDGGLCRYPIAKRFMKYKDNHWFPVTICSYELAKTQKGFVNIKFT